MAGYDPQVAAFQRTMGYGEADARAQAAARKAAMQRQYALRSQEAAAQMPQQLEGVMNNYAARGVSSSGVRVQEQDRLVQAHQRQAGREATTLADDSAGIDMDLNRTISDWRRRLAEMQLEAQRRNTIAAGQAALGSI